jgi:hypothetical protein
LNPGYPVVLELVLTGVVKPPKLAIMAPSPWPGVSIALEFPVGVGAPNSTVSASVFSPTTTLLPPLSRLITVPLTVIAGPPAFSVCVPTRYSGTEEAERRILAACVFPLITTELPPGRRDSTVPETVIADPPGMRVCVPRTYWVGDGETKLRSSVVLVPMAIAAPLVARE